jgi:hypothetical protein
MAKQYKILVPKPAAANELGTDVKLYEADELVDGSEEWQENLMQQFLANGWAMEVKVEESPKEKVTAKAEIKRARNEDGTLKGDDLSTPDVNEAWEGGKAPAKKTTKKKSTAKKSTKKAK